MSPNNWWFSNGIFLCVRKIVICDFCFTASEVFCWGQNKYGQLGLGIDCKKQASPQLIKSLLGIPFMQIAAGGAHSFVLTLSGAIFGWGRNKFGQLGLNDENGRFAFLIDILLKRDDFLRY